MTKDTKAFKITISILLSLSFILIALLIHDVYLLDTAMSDQESYGISVAGIEVTRKNEDDILGDGTVFYDPDNSTLVFANAEIKTDKSIINSTTDLGICLIGENKFISTSSGYIVLISAVDYYNTKDLYVYGDGSLNIEYLNTCTDSAVIQCDDFTVLSNITLTTPDCTNLSNGIVCDSSFKLLNGATVTVNGSSAKSHVAFRVRGNMLLDAGTTVNVSIENGYTDLAKGITVSGDLIIGDGASVNVSVKENAAKNIECLRVNGLLEIGSGSVVSATSAKSYAIECYGSMKLCGDAVINATSENLDVDVICYGAAVNYGATVNGKIEALGLIYNK